MAILTREERNEILCLVFDNWRSPDLPTLTPEQIISLVMSKYDRLNNQYESVRSFVRRALREEIISIDPSAWTPNLTPRAADNTLSTTMSSLEAEVPKSRVSNSLRDAESTSLNDEDIGTSDDTLSTDKWENKIIAACYRTRDFLKYYIYPVADEGYNSCRKRRTKIYKRLGEDGYNKYGTTDDTTGHKVIVNIPAVDDEIINQLKEKTYMFTAASNDIGTNNKPNNSTVSNEYCTTLNGKPSVDGVHLDTSTKHVHRQEEERNDMQCMELERDVKPSSHDGSGDMRLTGGSSPTTLSAAPTPPPSTPKVQLIMLQTLLQHRKVQIQQLPQRYLLSFANDIISDLTKSRYEQNQYSEGEQRKGWSIDLAVGSYSDLLLTGRVESSALAPNRISPDDIALHLLALAYRSMDETLASAMRKHGLDALQSAFTKLEYWLQKWTSDKERKKKNLNNWKKRLSPVDGEKKGDEGEIGDESSSPLEKRQRKNSPEILQAMETDKPREGEKSLTVTPEEGEISEKNNDPMEVEPTEMKHNRDSPERPNDKDKRLGEESSLEEGEVKDTPKDSGLPVAMDTDQPIGESIGRINKKNKTDNSALGQTEVPKELLKSPPELGLLGKASGGATKAPEDLQQQSQTGFVEMFTCDVCKKAFPTYAEADVHEKECMARKSQPKMLDTTGGSTVTPTQVTEKLNKSDSTETEDPKKYHDRLLEKYKNKKNFQGVNVINNSGENNSIQAFVNATDYHQKFTITKVGGFPLTLVEAAYASDQAFVVGYYLHKTKSKSFSLMFAYLNSMLVSLPNLAAFRTRQVYSKQFHEFAGSFTDNPLLNFFDFDSLNKAYKKEVKKRQLDLTGDGISSERRKDIFVAVVDAIIKNYAPLLQEVPQQQQQEVPRIRINPTEEELSDVIVI